MALRADDVDLGRDRALVEQHQQGDVAAFEDLYRRYYARLFRFCLRRTGNPHDAEEVAQEAFARAYRAMPVLRGERRFYPWLSVIASRLCIDSHRRLGRTEPAADVDPGSVSDPDRLDVAVDHELLVRAMGRLTPRHREVLHLREREGWSYQRIADHYDVSLGAVEGRLFRARQALRREFLAVAGPDAGLAAAAPLALPLAGRVGRRLTGLRLRMSEWAANWSSLPAVAANGVGVAMMVTTAAGIASSVVSPDEPKPVTVVVAAPVAAMSSVPSGLAVAPVVPHDPHADDEGAVEGQASAQPAPRPSDPRLIRTGEAVGYRAAKERSSDGDVAPSAGPVVAGVYVEDAAKSAQSQVGQYVTQVQGELP